MQMKRGTIALYGSIRLQLLILGYIQQGRLKLETIYMLFLVTENKWPLRHASSGNLVNSSNFLHTRRILEFFDLIFCTKGIVYISQNGVDYVMTPGSHLLLFPGYEHYGYKVVRSHIFGVTLPQYSPMIFWMTKVLGIVLG